MQGSLRGGKVSGVTDGRRLIVMRHAKAEPYAATDEERRLTARGRREAAEAGERLAELRVVPDHAVVSTSARTRMTWDEVAGACGGTAEVRYDEAVYRGGVEEVVETLQVTPEEASTVILVGHNPATSDLVHLLDDGEGEPDAVSGLLRGFPAGALAVFEVVVPWAELGPDTGRVTAFHAPHV